MLTFPDASVDVPDQQSPPAAAFFVDLVTTIVLAVALPEGDVSVHVQVRSFLQEPIDKTAKTAIENIVNFFIFFDFKLIKLFYSTGCYIGIRYAI